MTAPPEPPAIRNIAAFDFDGTLIRADALVPFMVRTHGRWRVVLAAIAAAPSALRARIGRVRGGPHHRDVAKERMLRRLYAGRSADEVAAAGLAYAATLPARLRPEVMAQVAWHRAQGHELVIVSASLLVYLEPFAADHGFDHVIGVGLEAGPDGRLTGRLTGPNVRGPEKEVRFREWIGSARPITTLWAYGDSTGDAELLAMADHGVRVDVDQVQAALLAVRH
ncbi:MAG: HAD-superfamily subfamily hydrolase [Acidimicrobiales bacterium]|nr:HAD-superfamily subfamily hydrolase [Acidimicrobiales bacterium]